MIINKNTPSKENMGGENEKILMDCILKCIIPRRNIIIKIENIKSYGKMLI